MGITLAINPGGIQHDDKLGFSHMTRFSTKNVHGLVPWTSEYQVGSGNRTNNWWTKATETWPPRDMRSIIRYVWALCFEVVHDWRRFILGSEHSAAINSTWIRELWCLFRYLNWRHLAMLHTFHGGVPRYSVTYIGQNTQLGTSNLGTTFLIMDIFIFSSDSFPLNS